MCIRDSIQFHPTALYEPGLRGHSFLITEAVRGDGGILRNADGEAFMERYDSRKDLAPRDIVARAIDNEMKINGTEYVYLDCRHMNQENFLNHFPNIHAKCLSIGIDAVSYTHLDVYKRQQINGILQMLLQIIYILQISK